MKRKDSKFFYLLFFFLTIFSFVYTLHEEYYIEIENQEKITSFFEAPTLQEEISKKEETKIEEYLAVLEIPSIRLKRGFFPLQNKQNNVKYNIQLIEKSTMPEIENSNLILASHNGTSPVSFFRNLYQLKEGEILYIYNKGYRYTYQFSHKYEVEKTGKIQIIRDNNRITLTLITCKKGSKAKQEVYISYLIDKQTYP